MAFDLHKVLKYLYDKNSSSFENISYIIKQNLTDGREDVFITFDMLVDEDIIMVMPRSKEHKDHYYKLGCPNFESGEINTLDNFPLMVKMTTTGREFYQRTYLVNPQKVSFKFWAIKSLKTVAIRLQMNVQLNFASFFQRLIARLKFIAAAARITFILSPAIPLR